MKQTKIIGILIRDRIKEAGMLQALLSKHNQIIRSRLGFHELTEEICSRVGIIVITLSGEPESWKNFENELAAIEGIEVQNMSFEY